MHSLSGRFFNVTVAVVDDDDDDDKVTTRVVFGGSVVVTAATAATAVVVVGLVVWVAVVGDAVNGDGIDKQTKLINLDQSKTFDWVDHQFLAEVRKTVGFKLELCKLISIPKRKTLRIFAIDCNDLKLIAMTLKWFGCPNTPEINLMGITLRTHKYWRWLYHNLKMTLRPLNKFKITLTDITFKINLNDLIWGHLK